MSLVQIILKAKKAYIKNDHIILENLSSQCLIIKTEKKSKIKWIHSDDLFQYIDNQQEYNGFITGNIGCCDSRFASLTLTEPVHSNENLLFSISEYDDNVFNLDPNNTYWKGVDILVDINLRLRKKTVETDFTQFEMFCQSLVFSNSKLELSECEKNVIFFQPGIFPFSVPNIQPQSLHVFTQNFNNRYPLFFPFAIIQDFNSITTCHLSDPKFDVNKLVFDYRCLSGCKKRFRHCSILIIGPAIPLQSMYYDILGTRIFTQTYGNLANHRKLLIVNGGPGADYQYMKNFSNLYYFGYTVYFYSQAGCFPSGNLPEIADYTMSYYADELEEVRKKLLIEGKDCFICGHSFGGLIIYQWCGQYPSSLSEINGLILSDTGYSIPGYNRYSGFLLSTFPTNIQKEILYFQEREEYTNPRYIAILNDYYNYIYFCQIVPFSLDQQSTFQRLNVELYNYLQGPNEFVVTGTLKDFDQSQVLPKITVPSLCIVGTFDTFDPVQAVVASKTIPKGILAQTSGSHQSFIDRPFEYFQYLLDFLSVS